ncbi:hypothetical protein GE118_02135 [Mycoplasma sp. NEAQ87857]|uniref:hypothetical protein n=1 Tax=Mycoplasma sp. NEAQ87857 TaxID=2683967 RepID=UPI001315D90A|nr:hypothetical protein [Mycoplasma sp. NEAQ87857]QGZ97594.1 hypothetical protein GE118_02135 [Mycoplasma sp. NEAQ87857]
MFKLKKLFISLGAVSTIAAASTPLISASANSTATTNTNSNVNNNDPITVPKVAQPRRVASTELTPKNQRNSRNLLLSILIPSTFVVIFGAFLYIIFAREEDEEELELKK